MSKELPPLSLQYLGAGEFRAYGRIADLCDRELVCGQSYRFERIEERSQASHAHYFACIQSAWSSLPESIAVDYPTAEHLRKRALIKAGYRDERSIVCASKAEALRVAAFVRPMDDYAVVTTSEAVVRVYTAQSQSYKAMGKEVFQRSKDDVLAIISEMIGTDATTLSRSEAA